MSKFNALKHISKQKKQNKEDVKDKALKALLKVLWRIFQPLIIIIAVMMFLILIVAGPNAFIPDIEPDKLDELQSLSTHCKVPWEEILAVITVTHDNDFEYLDVDQEVANFLIIRYEKFRVETHEEENLVPLTLAKTMGWEILSEVDEKGQVLVRIEYKETISEGETYLTEASQIYSFAKSTGLQDVSDLYEVFDHIVALDDTDEYDIFPSSKEGRDFFDHFTSDQLDWYNLLISENVIHEVYGEHFELPDEIIDQTVGFFQWPVPGLTNITSEYGWREDPIYSSTAFHHGVDAASSDCLGKPVVAAAKGRVIGTQHKFTGYGFNVTIEHIDAEGQRWVTRYAHLNQIEVKIGDEVNRGTVIGAVGNTGRSTGPHIHFEIKFNGVHVDPLKLVTPK